MAARCGPYAVGVTTRARASQNLVPWLVTLAAGVSGSGQTDPLSVTLLLLETLPLIVRRRWPIAVLAVTVAATVAHAYLVEGQVANESLGALVALFTVAERYDRRASVVAGLLTAASFLGLVLRK